MDHIPRLSEVLYVGLCRKIGTPTEVSIRRDVLDMEEMIQKPVDMYVGLTRMRSGSYREGFRFNTSDRDVMLWKNHHKMISEISQSCIYDTSNNTIILLDDTDTPPGFVRLQLLTQPKDIFIPLTIVSLNGTVYLSNLLWREKWLQLAMFRGIQNINGHGPCTSGYIGSIEFDIALCLTSIHWPKLARYWMERSLNHTWPPAYVLEEIFKNGYHCVPIGNNILSPFYELEWRLSFSGAEQKLVCTMNHTQFLCYGLLKIFLKEVISHSIDEPILCSYHVKTTIFWMIQFGCIQWRPNNLLNCFWNCFKYLIHCVYRGVFPNFFIPQNNMFANKVIGDARNCLLEQLNHFYRIGISCLLFSPSLRSILEPAMMFPSFAVIFVEGHVRSVMEIDSHVREEIFSFPFVAYTRESYFLRLKTIEKLIRYSLSPCQTITLQYCTANTLVIMAFQMANSPSCCSNKELYAVDKTICNMLKLAGRIGCLSDSLYLALYHYRMGRYTESILLINIIRKKLSQPFIMYRRASRQSYEAVCSMSLYRRMKISWIDEVHLCADVPCIQELMIEQQIAKKNLQTVLFISPFLLVEMLSVLSNYRQGNMSQYQKSLTHMKTLLFYDDGRYVPLSQRDLHWQILGICQYVVGDLNGALQSFQESLEQDPFNKIGEATEARIRCVESQLHRVIP